MARLTRGANICLIVSAALMIVVALITLVGVLCIDQLWITLLRKRVAIIPDSQIFANWVSPSVPIYFYIYMYNLTNPEAVLQGGRPHFTEYGPLVYREDRQRFNITWAEGETPPKTIDFQHRIWYHFVPEMSVAPETEGKITSLNLPLVTLASGMRTRPALLSILSFVFDYTSTTLFITRSPKELIWGFEDSFLELCNTFAPQVCQTTRVGLMVQANGSTVYNYTVDTGVTNADNVGRILKFGGKTKLDYWHSEEANMINGTDGSTVRPGLSIGSRIRFFVPDMCRSFHSDAVGTTTAIHRSDIQLLSFVASKEQALNATINPNNRGFCANNSAGPVCPPTGVMDLSVCRKAGAIPVPIYASQPHFYGADPAIPQAFDGLIPPSHNDSTALHIEPMTGFILQAFKRLQINMFVNNSGLLPDQFQKLGGPYFWPIAWFREEALADRPALDRIYQLVIRPKKLLTSLLTVVCAVALLLGVLCVVFLLTCARLRSSSRGQASPSRTGLKTGASSALTTSTTSAGADAVFDAKKQDHQLDDYLTGWHGCNTPELKVQPGQFEQKPLLSRNAAPVV